MQKRSIEWLSVAQVAEQLGMSHSGAKFFVITGQIPSTKIGNMYLVHVADFEDFMKERATKPRKGRWAKREIADHGTSSNSKSVTTTSQPPSSKVPRAKRSNLKRSR